MIALIDYGMGNLFSVSKALTFAGADKVELLSLPGEISSADALILPGVGNFGDGMRHLCKYGFADAIRNFIASGKPFLGICLGMQLLMDESEEAPGVHGLGIFRGKVVKFQKMGLKIPHMGWNQLKKKVKSPFLDSVPDNSFFYFVHSYYVLPEDGQIAVGTSEYVCEFAACIGKGNVFATQFHPEKSQDCGIRILKNFISNVRKTNG